LFVRLAALGAAGVVFALALGPNHTRAGKHALTIPYRQPGWSDSVLIQVPGDLGEQVKDFAFEYVSHDGVTRRALLLLPRHYDASQPLPLVISPHGRGVSPEANVLFWGDLPGRDGFAVVIPAGMGRKLALYSWGYDGEIDDLARMPALAESALPGLRIDRQRVYAMGGSMGGQESLLLLARYPHLLAGVASFDAPTDMAKRYARLGQLAGGSQLQRFAREEFGGSPQQVPAAYAERSPITYAREIADSGVPLQIWWSNKDAIVRRQFEQSGALYKAIMRANPNAPVVQIKGMWHHTAEMEWDHRLPSALARFGIVPLG
jgi:dipeptidyl aminopeptidase/acylaminoacyl peptidase